MGSGASPPQPTDPGQTAATQSAFNTQAGRSSQSGSMVGQANPYGTLNYSQTGVDQFGNPIYGANLAFSQPGQQLFDTQLGAQSAAGQGGRSLIQNANYGGQSPTDAIGNETSGIQGGLMSQWLQSQGPWMQQADTQLDTQLRNQGLNPSPTATNDPSTWGPYEKAMGQLRQSQQMGVAGAASQFQPQAFSEATSLYGLPAQLGMTLSQFGAPTNPGSSLVQTPGLNITPPNFEGDVQASDQEKMQAFIAQQQQQAAMIQGLFGFGGNVVGGMARGGTGIFA